MRRALRNSYLISSKWMRRVFRMSAPVIGSSVPRFLGSTRCHRGTEEPRNRSTHHLNERILQRRRISLDLRRGSLGDDEAAMDDHDAVGEGFGFGEVVRG